MPKNYQVAAIPVRHSASGSVEVLLITSRATRRWVVPKGWPWPKIRDSDAAAGEAWEEAGVRGRLGHRSIGTFTYDKQENGDHRPLEVLVYLLEVVEVADRWPEFEQRRREWFTPAAAARLVEEPGLKKLLLALEA